MSSYSTLNVISSMPEFRFLSSSDEHVSDKSPNFRKDQYRDSILEKLEWQGIQAKKINANAILRGGDLFHIKPANKNSMRLVSMISKIHKQYSCPTFAIPGNHDISNNNMDSLPGQPLGVLYNAGVLNNLTESIFEIGSFKVRIVGVPYSIDLDSESLCERVRKKDENITIAVVHALSSLAPSDKIQSFFNEPILDYRDLVFNGCPDVYIFGHYHKDQGITDLMGTKFINLGSISRGSLTLENVERKPKVASIKVTPNGVNVEEIIIPHKDPSEVFDFDLKKKQDKWRTSIDDFINLHREDGKMVTDDGVEARCKLLDKFPDDIKKMCLDILEQAKEMESE